MRALTILVLLVFILVFAFFTQGDSTGRPCGEKYILQQGDTLADVAARCGTTLDTLLAWNPQIQGPEDIRVGGIINLPPADADATLVVVQPNAALQTPAGTPLVIVPAATSTPLVLVPVTGGEVAPQPAAPAGDVAPAPAAQPQPSGGGTTTYVVQQCDTLFGIATYYGTSVAAIQSVNPQITNPDIISVGQVITIPLP